MKDGHKNRAYPLVDGWTYKTIIMHDCSCILTPICFENMYEQLSHTFLKKKMKK